MAGTIKLKHSEWIPIRNKIKADYPPSYILISSVTRRELGFVIREHRDFSNTDGYRTSICLDFYDDQQETMFRLKYL